MLRIYVQWSKQHGFKPLVLKEIVFLRDKGYSNVEIAQDLGISRNTVSSYLEKMRQLQDEEIAQMLSLIGLMMSRRRDAFRSLFKEMFT